MIKFGAQINCVHKFIYGHKNSTSHNQGERRPVSPARRGIQACRHCAHPARRRLGIADRPRIEDQYESAVHLAQALRRRGACQRRRPWSIGGRHSARYVDVAHACADTGCQRAPGVIVLSVGQAQLRLERQVDAATLALLLARLLP